jgi:hypothetical protein
MLASNSKAEQKRIKDPNHTLILPGCVYISNQFQVDFYEITCFNWLEYLYWNAKIFGKNSDEYRAALPDTNVWIKVDERLSYLSIDYLRSPVYRDHPVVGISQEQARAFGEWRADRVFERYLIKRKLLLEEKNQTPETYFTTERYYSRELSTIIGEELSEYYIEFRLPTLRERNSILRYVERIHARANRKNSKCWRFFEFIVSDIELCFEDGCPSVPTRNVGFGCKDIGLSNIRGNVSEWLSTPGIAAGGSWHDKRDDILKQDLREYDGPNAFTGFRNVGEWVKWRD